MRYDGAQRLPAAPRQVCRKVCGKGVCTTSPPPAVPGTGNNAGDAVCVLRARRAHNRLAMSVRGIVKVEGGRGRV